MKESQSTCRDHRAHFLVIKVIKMKFCLHTDRLRFIENNLCIMFCILDSKIFFSLTVSVERFPSVFCFHATWLLAVVSHLLYSCTESDKR